MLAARLSGNSQLRQPPARQVGGCLIPLLPSPAKASDHVANITGGSARSATAAPHPATLSVPGTAHLVPLMPRPSDARWIVDCCLPSQILDGSASDDS